MQIRRLKFFRIALVSSICLFLSACSSAGLSLLNTRAKLAANHSVVRDISYGAAPWQNLDLYIPDNSPLSSKPALVFFYGGGWDSGSKQQYYFAASKFANLGYWVIVPDYVKYPQRKFPTFIEDGAHAIAWLKNNIDQYGGNPNNLFVVGHSAGAHLGALVLSDPTYLAKEGLTPMDIKAFAGLAGPYSFTPKAPRYTRIFAPPSIYPRMQALNFINGQEPPMLLLHGDKDNLVNVANKNTLIDAINDAGGNAKGIDYPGVSHIGIVLGLTSPWLGNADPGADIHDFFLGYLSD